MTVTGRFVRALLVLSLLVSIYLSVDRVIAIAGGRPVETVTWGWRLFDSALIGALLVLLLRRR